MKPLVNPCRSYVNKKGTNTKFRVASQLAERTPLSPPWTAAKTLVFWLVLCLAALAAHFSTQALAVAMPPFWAKQE